MTMTSETTSLATPGQRYGVLARLLHWAIAICILALIATGLLSDDLPKPAAILFHKALGIVTLALALIRLGWWALDRTRPGADDLVAWRRHAATVVKYALAALTVIMPVSGWLMSSAAGKPIWLLSTFIVPPLLSPDKGLAHLFKEVHETAANLLIVLLALHIGAALFHHFFLKDDVLARMVPHLPLRRRGDG